jgi:hypothetical protein
MEYEERKKEVTEKTTRGRSTLHEESGRWWHGA